MIKKGDTLVEVTLAIGIFSMIAVSVTAVMNSSTSGSQTNLETTLAREEIDIQAEALRFINSSYAASQDNADTRYKELWQAISAEKAVKLAGNDEDEKILEYQPESCSAVYEEDFFKDNGIKAFAISTTALGEYTNINNNENPKPDDVLIKDFRPTETYPRLIGSTAEGIYIIAVPDRNTTSLVAGVENEPAFYDFYIRTCWYGTDAENPSTISTVVRLYNPDAVVAVTPAEQQGQSQQSTVQLVFNGNNNNGGGTVESIQAKPGEEATLRENKFIWKENNYNGAIQFVGWSTDPNAQPGGTSKIYGPNETITVPNDTTSTIVFYAIWKSEATFWLDLNTFLDGVIDNHTGGFEGFEADIIINGKTEASNVIDFYQEVTLGSRIKIILNKWPSNYHLANFDTICNKIYGCNIKEFKKRNYIITFEIVPESLSSAINSTGNYAINVEPMWIKN